jgi:replicative DNA helicase
MLDNNSTAEEVIDRLTEEATAIVNHDSKQTTIPLGTAAPDFIEDMIELQKNPNAIKRFGVKTGIRELDDILVCLPKGSMTVISGKIDGTNKSRGSGKTAFALQLLANAAMAGTPAAMISLEMSAKELACRRISSMNLIDQTLLRSGKISVEQLNLVISKNYDVPLYFEEVGDGAMTISEYRRRSRKLVAQKKVGIICIDYAQLMIPDKPTGNMAVDVMMIANSIKASATELGIPIIAVSQLSRGGDVAWSSFLEYNPHVMLQVLQPELPNGTAKIIIEKQRQGASHGRVEVVWKPEFQLFAGRETRYENQPLTGTRIGGSQ